MNKLLTVLFFLLNISYIVSAQTGKVFDNLSMSSKILKMDRKYAIYLPPDYDTSERSYPILYLLHGAGEDQRGWIQFGEVMTIADEAIKSGKATAMIIVMPDAFTVKRGYVNDILDEWRYEDFFFQEFMPYIEQKYRIIGQRDTVPLPDCRWEEKGVLFTLCITRSYSRRLVRSVQQPTT